MNENLYKERIKMVKMKKVLEWQEEIAFTEGCQFDPGDSWAGKMFW